MAGDQQSLMARVEGLADRFAEPRVYPLATSESAAHAADLRAVVALLRDAQEALEPFAKVAASILPKETFIGDDPDAPRVMTFIGAGLKYDKLTSGFTPPIGDDFRRASTILARLNAAEGGS